MITVTKDGKTVYSKGFGYADLENRVEATPHSVVRIASISKAITCAIAGKLIENGQLNIDKPIDFYLNDIPKLKFENNEVNFNSCFGCYQ
jgi:serine beta-lactamase-like protein LACTB, mitochondrial